eukprot:g8316.t1
MLLTRLVRFSQLPQCWQFLTHRGSSRRRVLIKLTKDVKHLGKQDDIVYVKPGHMRHDLYPSRKAVYALSTDHPTAQSRPPRVGTRSFINVYFSTVQVMNLPSNEELVYDQVDQVVDRLTKKVLEIRLAPLKHDQDKTNPPLTTEMLANFIKQKMKIVISPTLLSLESPITESGTYQIPLNFIHNNKKDLTIQLKVLENEETN